MYIVVLVLYVCKFVKCMYTHAHTYVHILYMLSLTCWGTSMQEQQLARRLRELHVILHQKKGLVQVNHTSLW